MLVVCEIPYAKYLDCGMDMFAEIVVDGWLNRGNNSSEQKATTSGGGGMIIRLQGFDRGVFGGNFHTHNALPLLPGLDVVVHSNGADWVKGWRYAVRQAAAGRVVDGYLVKPLPQLSRTLPARTAVDAVGGTLPVGGSRRRTRARAANP